MSVRSSPTLEPVEERTDAEVMLLGEHLGGSHQGALVAALHRR